MRASAVVLDGYYNSFVLFSTFLSSPASCLYPPENSLKMSLLYGTVRKFGLSDIGR